MAMAHELRSSVAAQMVAGATEFELEPQYVDFGRIAFVNPASGANYQLKSRAALPFELPLPLDGDHISVSPDVVFLVVFDFVDSELILEIVPARMVKTERRRRFQLLDGLTPLGAWSDHSHRRRSTGFNQQDDDEGERPWWKEDDGTGDEFGPTQ
jgi:hypothetical protein